MKDWIVKWFLGGVVRDIAEGKRGETAKKAYWWMCGRKRTWTALAGLAFAALTAFNPQLAVEWAPRFALVLGIAVTIGIADKDWKTAPPPVEWAKTFHTIMSAGPILSVIVAFALQYLRSLPDCAWCAASVPQIEHYVAAIGMLSAWLAARFAEPPAFPARRVEDRS